MSEGTAHRAISGTRAADPAEQKRQKLLAALVAQGFKKTESKKAVAKLAGDATTLSPEQLIRRALELLVSR